MKNINWSLPVALICLLSLTSGCASIVKGTTQAIPVSSNPSGADVALDGNKIGQTPISIEVKRKTDHLITISKPGYNTESIAITRNFGGAVLGNILAGGLIGWGVDAVSGAQYNLTPTTISMNLYKSGEEPDSYKEPRQDAAVFIGKLKELDNLRDSKQITDEEYVKMRLSLVNSYSGGESAQSSEPVGATGTVSPMGRPPEVEDPPTTN